MPEIYLMLDGKQTGPFSGEQLRQMLAEGKINNLTRAWYKELPDWGTMGAMMARFPAEFPARAPQLPLPQPPPPPAKELPRWALGAIIAACALVALVVFSCFAGVLIGPFSAGVRAAKQNVAMLESRAIALSMIQYAGDHNGAYPPGKTSTEVFQTLLDQKYITDPGLFYVQMPGKVKATSSTLSAENVCFDVTGGATSDSSDELPLVFLTGYTVTYAAGAGVSPDSGGVPPLQGLAVTYKSGNAHFFKGDPDGTIEHCIPADFDPGDKTYVQLRP